MISESKDNKALAEILLPDTVFTPSDIIAKYPPRRLPAGARVTRIAPSPTGFMHIGGLYAALISERLGHQSGGLFFLRLEDTDKKREVAGATELIISALEEYGIKIDEGLTASGQEKGEYGPYRQSERRDIYQAFVKYLLITGDAYPAFETTEELEALAAEQAARKIAPGYYGEWAAWRERPLADIETALLEGRKPVIRLKSQGDLKKYREINDLFKGKLSLPENDQDVVILKSDGLPTYHFAHAIDDHFMGTTDVIRGDEWLPSLPLHIQLFERLGFLPPRFGHIAPIQKLEGNSRRKLSKRHDPEANVSFYAAAGYPPEAVVMYLLNLANASFEAWRLASPGVFWNEYRLAEEELKKGAGALLDLQKLDSISKEYIGALPPDELLKSAVAWAKINDQALAGILQQEKDYAAAVLNIERTGDKARKDLTKWSDIKLQFGFFFDSIFAAKGVNREALANIRPEDIRLVAERVSAAYNQEEDQGAWLERMRSLSEELGFAREARAFKESPEKYKGNFADFAKIIRVLLAGENRSPDLWETMKVMGRERVAKRLESGKNF